MQVFVLKNGEFNFIFLFSPPQKKLLRRKDIVGLNRRTFFRDEQVDDKRIYALILFV